MGAGQPGPRTLATAGSPHATAKDDANGSGLEGPSLVSSKWMSRTEIRHRSRSFAAAGAVAALALAAVVSVPRPDPAVALPGRGHGVTRAPRRVAELPLLPRRLLPEVVHLLPRPRDAAPHGRLRAGSTDPAGEAARDRRAELPGRDRHRRRPRRGDGAGRQEDPRDRPGAGRQERLLLPDPPRPRPPPGPARRLRHEPQGVVLDHRQRGPPLRRRDERGARLDGPRLHVQHLLLQLPREPARDQLRAGDRLVPDGLGRARRLVRDLPRAGRRAREGVRGSRSRRDAEGLEDHLGEEALEGAAQRPVRLLPRQGEPRCGPRSAPATASSTTSTSRRWRTPTTTPTGATSARTTRSPPGA